MDTKNKLFIGIFGFMLIINLLVIFNLNFIYLREILCFIFLMTIPGLLIMLCLRIRKISFWEYLVCVIGISMFFIMFAGLFANSTFKISGFTQRPLSTLPILMEFDVLLLILIFIAYRRNYDLDYKIELPKFNFIDRVLLILSFILPLLSIIGALILNNNVSNMLTVIVFLIIGILTLLMVIYRNKINENVFPIAIFFISASLLFLTLMRSWYVSGIDISEEYSIFQTTKNISFWQILEFRKDYSSMLSVSIFPTILSIFMKGNDHYIFKLFIPWIFCIVPIIIYLFCRKYTSGVNSFLAVIFFMSQPMFINIGIPMRQQISFVFLGLMFLILFLKDIKPLTRNFLFFIFGISMIVSHYSTSYVAIALFSLAYGLIFFYRLYEKREIKKVRLKKENREKFNLNLPVIILLIAFIFIWYTQVTPAADGLIDFASKSIVNLGNIFSEEVQLKGQGVMDQFKISSNNKNSNQTIQSSSQEIINDYRTTYPSNDFYDAQNYSEYESKINLGNSNNVNYKLLNEISSLRELFKNIGKVIIILGVLYMLFLYFRKNKEGVNKEYLIINISSFILLCFIVVLPFASINYDLGRTYQQLLLVLCLSSVLGLLLLFKPIKEKYRIILVALFIIFYFLFLSRGVQQIIIGQDSGMIFDNTGFEYYAIYTHASEIYSGNWLFNNYDSSNAVYSDHFAYYKLTLAYTKVIMKRVLVPSIFPSIVRKGDYVYLNYNNIVKDRAYRPYKSITLDYNYPDKFFEENKNKIYNNGGSEIFK